MISKMKRCLALVAAVAAVFLLGNCSGGGFRSVTDFEAAKFLKHVQIWAVEGNGHKTSIVKPTRSLTVNGSPAVPITRDGYFLATSHGVPKGSDVLTMRDAANLPVYLTKVNESGPAEFQTIAVKSPLRYERQTGIPAGIREQRLRVVKRHFASDLVLLKASFPTQDYVEVLSSVPAPGEPVYFPTNPLLGERSALLLTPLERIEITSSGTWFVAVDHMASYGYSGTPMMNPEGKLIALGAKGLMSKKHPKLWGSGMSWELLEEMIAADRAAHGGR